MKTPLEVYLWRAQFIPVFAVVGPFVAVALVVVSYIS
jgi:hypothetical protein